MTGIQPVNLSNVQQVADEFLDKGCNTIILTLGPLGAAYASRMNRNVTRIATTEVQPVDTTVRIAYTVSQNRPSCSRFHDEVFFQSSLNEIKEIYSFFFFTLSTAYTFK